MNLPDTPQERAAVIAWRLAQGEALSVGEAVALLGVTERRAQQLFRELSRVLPIFRDDDSDRWLWVMVKLLKN
ncbi:MAG: hypothetical protein ACE5F6_17610 [Anaerolineae bacterium]